MTNKENALQYETLYVCFTAILITSDHCFLVGADEKV